MKLSIITPTHDDRYLPDLESSILANDYTDWEWVILLNGGAMYHSGDSRVKIVACPFVSDHIGALKREACRHATGEVIVEADHDDQLTGDCLSTIAEVFRDPTVGFAYSDCAHLGEFTAYNPALGWNHYPFEWQGQTLKAMRSQPLYPGRLANIAFAPDHVRAWRKSVYDEVGGHDAAYPVCDDQDLICRLFLATKFTYIPRVLYIYRESDGQTYRQRQKVIEDLNWMTYDRYIYRVASRWAEKQNLLKIDLCQTHQRKVLGFVAVNRTDSDIITDFERGIPVPRGSVGVIRAHDALNRFPSQMKIMAEIHRVLAPGGLLLSMTPSTEGRGAWQSPASRSYWNENTFWYFTREKYMREIDNPVVHFRECRLVTRYPDEMHERTCQPYTVAHLEKIPL